jgi:hypothetical protein
MKMEQVITNLKALKFRALAEQRVSSVLRMVKRIGKLSRRSSYEYTPDQISKMFKAMRDELAVAERQFAPGDKQEQGSLFRLD